LGKAVQACDDLLRLLRKCKEKNVDVSAEEHDVRLARERLAEALPVLDWALERLEDIDSAVSGDERLLVEAVDGSNGLLAARSTLYDMLKDLDDLEGILRDAKSACENFLAGKADEKVFRSGWTVCWPGVPGWWARRPACGGRRIEWGRWSTPPGFA